MEKRNGTGKWEIEMLKGRGEMKEGNLKGKQERKMLKGDEKITCKGEMGNIKSEWERETGKLLEGNWKR